jgi:predicted transport protein
MSDLKLFRLATGKTLELQASASDLERPLQRLIEDNMDALLGVRFLATEYPTGRTHAGRIDSLGLDENNCPVILEYKRSTGENVINQGLFYLDWLMDHQAEFKLLVMDKLGKAVAGEIDWSSPRLVCVAADFTKYDGYAVQQINRNIDLVRYKQFGRELLLLELVRAVTARAAPSGAGTSGGRTSGGRAGPGRTVAEWLADPSLRVRELFDSLEGYVMSLGDDVQRKDLRLYVAFKRLKNFATVAFQREKLLVDLHLDPSTVSLVEGFSRDVSNIGHWGTGDLELALSKPEDLDRAKDLIRRAYEGGQPVD